MFKVQWRGRDLSAGKWVVVWLTAGSGTGYRFADRAEARKFARSIQRDVPGSRYRVVAA